MAEDYPILSVEKPDDPVWKAVGGGIHDYNAQHADDLRGRGYGHRLLAEAEEEARRRGVKNAYLDTFSFQAPGFYLKQGYHVFGELPDFPPGHRRFFLAKRL